MRGVGIKRNPGGCKEGSKGCSQKVDFQGGHICPAHGRSEPSNLLLCLATGNSSFFSPTPPPPSSFVSRSHCCSALAAGSTPPPPPPSPHPHLPPRLPQQQVAATPPPNPHPHPPPPFPHRDTSALAPPVSHRDTAALPQKQVARPCASIRHQNDNPPAHAAEDPLTPPGTLLTRTESPEAEYQVGEEQEAGERGGAGEGVGGRGQGAGGGAGEAVDAKEEQKLD
ncbi:unnamed protein product [Closterium sp. NIES-54]